VEVEAMGPAIGFVVLVAALVSFAMAFSVAVWVGSRRKEREAFYRAEERKKAIEHDRLDQWLAMVREEEDIAQRRGREGLKLVGLIMTAVGVVIPVGVFVQGEVVGAVFSSMTLWVGLVLLIYAFFLAPKPGSPRS
jgi:Flp pilus assembly protein TadB